MCTRLLSKGNWASILAYVETILMKVSLQRYFNHIRKILLPELQRLRGLEYMVKSWSLSEQKRFCSCDSLFRMNNFQAYRGIYIKHRKIKSMIGKSRTLWKHGARSKQRGGTYYVSQTFWRWRTAPRSWEDLNSARSNDDSRASALNRNEVTQEIKCHQRRLPPRTTRLINDTDWCEN